MFKNIQNLIFMYEYICDKALKKKKGSDKHKMENSCCLWGRMNSGGFLKWFWIHGFDLFLKLGDRYSGINYTTFSSFNEYGIFHHKLKFFISLIFAIFYSFNYLIPSFLNSSQSLVLILTFSLSSYFPSPLILVVFLPSLNLALPDSHPCSSLWLLDFLSHCSSSVFTNHLLWFL